MGAIKGLVDEGIFIHTCRCIQEFLNLSRADEAKVSFYFLGQR